MTAALWCRCRALTASDSSCGWAVGDLRKCPIFSYHCCGKAGVLSRAVNVSICYSSHESRRGGAAKSSMDKLHVIAV
jgi:hypothetical protein